MSLERRKAESSSRRGIVWVLRGATLVLVTTNLTVVSVSVINIRYTTAAYTCVEASQNPQSVVNTEDSQMPWK